MVDPLVVSVLSAVLLATPPFLVIVFFIVLHALILSYFQKLHFYWMYGRRMQQECDINSMEADTERYIVFRYIKDHEAERKRIYTAATVFFVLMVFVGIIPLLALLLKITGSLVDVLAYSQTSFESGSQRSTAFLRDKFANVLQLQPLKDASEVLGNMSVNGKYFGGILCLLSLISFGMYRADVGNSGAGLRDMLFNTYEKHLETVQDNLLFKLKDCGNGKSKSTAKNACLGTKLYQNLAKRILNTDEHESLQSAKWALNKLIESKSPDLIGYVCFHVRGPDFEALMTAAKGDSDAQDAIKYLSSLQANSPSRTLRSVMKKWITYLIVAFIVLIYLIYHTLYKKIDHATLIGAMVFAGLIVAAAGFYKNYLGSDGALTD